MAFSRATALSARPDETTLTRDMVGIGMNFAAEANPSAPIEETLVHASAAGMDDHDLRVLAVLTTWVGVHHPYINADRLVRCVSEHSSKSVHAYWAAVGRWLSKDRRFARLPKLHEGAPVDLLPVGTDFQLARRGQDERFADSLLRVPAGTLRDRDADVLSPKVLVGRHAGYHNRVLLGPTWRADVWTVLQEEPEVSVAEAARRAGCSFATAWQVVQDFRLLHAPPRELEGAAGQGDGAVAARRDTPNPRSDGAYVELGGAGQTQCTDPRVVGVHRTEEHAGG